MTKLRIVASLLVALLLVAGVIAWKERKQLQVLFVTRPGERMPRYKPVSNLSFANQNWSAAQREWYYHAGQGTVLMPYKWFLALEQPKIHIFGDVPHFRDTKYLAGFGFLPDATGPENPDGLPVGFGKDTVVDPASGQAIEVIGLTCAACHTGQLEYQGKGVRIDGGSATVDLAAFQDELGFAVGFTADVPFRFDRFARAVLGEDASPEAKRALRVQFDAVLDKGLTEKQANDDGKLYAAYGGFGRTDALGRIGNFVFGTQMKNDANLRVADAPVNFPYLWYTSWFDWVQYNSSIEQPMVRNIGEALGLRAVVNLTDAKAGLFRSTVDVKNLHAIENLLAGPAPFQGLKAPVWPAELFGPVDQKLAEKGKALYAAHCEKCHLPPLDSPEMKDQTSAYWATGLENKKFLRLNVIPFDSVGTDHNAAKDFAERTADTGALGLGTVSAAEGLRVVTGKVADLEYDALGLTPEQRVEWNGFRNDGVRAPLAYKPRPLSGIWATPPFLHNGSVPNLYQMLLPASQRDKIFYVGNREFDPKMVGYSTAPFENGFEYRTDQPNDPHPGNSNAGHEFRNAPPGKGVIGPELTDEERWAIIEYLKIL